MNTDPKFKSKCLQLIVQDIRYFHKRLSPPVVEPFIQPEPKPVAQQPKKGRGEITKPAQVVIAPKKEVDPKK